MLMHATTEPCMYIYIYIMRPSQYGLCPLHRHVGPIAETQFSHCYHNQWLNWFPYNIIRIIPIAQIAPIRLGNLGLNLLSLQCFLPATLNCYLATHGHTLNTV